MKSKKAQITIFIIIGIIIILSIGIILYVRGGSAKKELVAEVEKLDRAGEIAIRNYVEACLKKVSEDGLERIGMQGGYINISDPPDHIEDLPYNISYGLDNNADQNLLESYRPFLSVLEKDLQEFVNSELKTCIKEFSVFKEIGFEITAGIINTTVTLTEEEAIISLDYPLTIKKGEAEARINRFGVNIPNRLKKIHELAKNSIRDYFDSGNDLDKLGDSPYELDDFIWIATADSIVTIKDYKFLLKNNAYAFRFAIK